MIEDFALQYFLLPELQQQIYGWTFLVSGFLMGAIFYRSKFELQRGAYFAYIGIIVFCATLPTILWLGWVPAVVAGYLWLIVVPHLFIIFVLGFLCAVIAKARSRDAFGNAGLAFLFFIPFANFWLMLKSSKEKSSPSQISTTPTHSLKGGIGVLVGLGFLFLSAVTGSLTELYFTRIEISSGQEEKLLNAFNSIDKP